MYKRAEGFVYSPSDLIRFSESPFSTWMDRYHLERPGELKPDEESAEQELVAETGNRHEAAHLARIRADGQDVCEIPRDDPGAEERTVEALRAGRQVVYQGCLSANGFRGFTDFLVRDGSGENVRYEVWDTKLARKPKPYYLIQLCCYAEMLEKVLGHFPRRVRIVLGDGSIPEFNPLDYLHYYRSVRAGFLRQMAEFDPRLRPEPDPRADHGRWASHAERILEEADHLIRVANITVGQVRKLSAAGVTKMRQLANGSIHSVPRLAGDVLATLVEQARLQVRTEDARRAAGPTASVLAHFQIVPPASDQPRRGLATLPPASALDVYFDMEGYPLVNGGLEYLFGAVHVKDGESQFVDWWAHDSRGERAAFEAFIDWAHARWQADPTMHIFHYAAYEVSALRRLMGKYGTREEQVDELLRGGAFVDLYQIVRQGLRVGEASYSIKYIERLYRPPRAGAVATAGDSIVQYAHWMESGEPPDWRRSGILAGIRDYNRDDCESTLQLVSWLRQQQVAAKVAFIAPARAAPADAGKEADKQALVGEIRDLVRSLDGKALAATGKDEAVIHAMLRDLVEFHRREEKPSWWRLFERAAMSHEELKDDLACIGDATLVSPEGQKEKRSLVFRYRFDPQQDTKLGPGDRVKLAENIDVSLEITALSEDGDVMVKLGEATLAKKLSNRMPSRTSFLPEEIVQSTVLRDAIKDLASLWDQKGAIPPALAQFFLRRPPRVPGHADGTALFRAGEEVVTAATRIVVSMQDSLFCLQGPPGTGKTTTASRLIRELLGRGARVGITSNSHKAILNLLRACNKDMGGKLPGIKVGGDADDPIFAEAYDLVHVESSAEALQNFRGGVVAGTAWLFARHEWAGQLDYLFVDEAGQVSVANLVAMARVPRNIVLLGDQMQLEQPVQGTHPGESGLSALNYYLSGHATIPDHLGLFLSESHRMHPEVCRIVSDLAYEGRLRAAPGNELRRLLHGSGGHALDEIEAGVAFVPVAHEGNVQGSDEEVDQVVRLAGRLIDRELTDRSGRAMGKVSWSDILFVAPYNMQVRKLRSALPAGALVGSVDKFQGQEAPIVFLSMCSSYGEYGSRGLEFILDQNRMNVAISRAQVLAIVVGDPRIAQSPAGSIPAMRRLNLYCRLSGECVRNLS